MRIRLFGAAAAGLLATTTEPLEAQGTGDRAQLIFTVSGAFTERDGLWTVESQPVVDLAGGSEFTDNLLLSRGIMPTFGAGFSGTYYPGETVGLTGDAFLIGLGYEDNCAVIGGVQSAQTAAACEDIDDDERRAAAVTVSAGAVFRFFSREMISPFARVNAGVLFSNQSPILTEGFREDGAVLTIYSDDRDTRVTPAFTLGIGATTPLGRSYHLRWEIRDNIVGVEEVTGPAAGVRMEPPHELNYKHLLSILIGIDVILERSRGRRY
jgi:hypothetical protein